MPLVDLEFMQGRERHDAGVVDEDVDRAEFLRGERGERLHIVQAGDVEGAALGSAAGFANLRDDFLEAVGPAGSKEDFRAPASEQACGGLADAAAGAGDEDDFVFDIGFHSKCGLWFVVFVRCGVGLFVLW